ncbi:hypothetical protein [Alcaligenes sp. SDU_A2]|uniref:hypothetical protein n=1 Tax=Alcaligenes sp. SDU_A2 TaxID=3136634 RepID=UPI00311F3528
MDDLSPSHNPNSAELVSVGQLRRALAFVTEQYENLSDGTGDVLEWLWGAIQGDFNDERSTGQIVFDTAISMVPGVDQVCDARDLVANCKKINEDPDDIDGWIFLGMTLIGLIPMVGSLIKGVLKIFFVAIRRAAPNQLGKAVDEAMTWVITLLRKREVQKYWRTLLGWDNVFGELAQQATQIRNRISVSTLMQAFDRGIALLQNLADMVRYLPVVGEQAQATVAMVHKVRVLATTHLDRTLAPLRNIMDAIIQRLQLEQILQHHGIVDIGNVHFRGGLPEARAVTLMWDTQPPPAWLSRGEPERYKPLVPAQRFTQITENAKEGFPLLKDHEIASFAQGMTKAELRGPMRLYRVVSPGNQAASMDWVTEEVWQQIMSSPDPKAAWRKHLAVWPDWNADGQFVTYDIPPGQTLKVYRGPAAAQIKEDALPNHYLEGGWEQIKFDAAQVYDAAGNAVNTVGGQAVRHTDRSVFYRKDYRTGEMTRTDMDYAQYKRLPAQEQSQYEPLREEITHPNISGPFDTGWGYTDFDAQMIDAKLGLPALPGQLSELRQ